MSSVEHRPAFIYEHYEPGKSYGKKDFIFDEETLARWRKVYLADGEGEVMPAGMLAMIVLDAVLHLHTPRPPGGVHAGQTFEVTRLPRLGERMETEVICLGKEIRKDRRFVQVRTHTRTPAGETLFAGTMTTIVAA
jgi:hypothetical protein